MSKTKNPYLIALPGIIILVIAKIMPGIMSFAMSFRNYSPRGGVFGSEWVGLEYFKSIFDTYYFTRLIANTVRLSFSTAICTVILALILIVCIDKLPTWWSKCLALSVVAIPMLIPVYSFTGMVIETASSQGLLTRLLGLNFNLLSRSEYFTPLFSFVQALRGVFVPTLLGVLICDSYDRIPWKKLSAALLCYAVFRVLLFVSDDREVLLSLYNALIYERADTFLSLMYRKTLQEGGYGYSSAVYVIWFLMRLPLFLIAAFFLKRPLSGVDINSSISKKSKFGMAGGVSAVVLIALCIVFVFIGVTALAPGLLFDEGADYQALFTSASESMQDGDGHNFIASLGATSLYSLLFALLTCAVALLLSYPMTMKKRIYPALLFLSLAFAGSYTGMVIMDRSLSSVLGVYLSGAFLRGEYVIGAFALFYCVKPKLGGDVPEFRDYCKLCVKPLVALFVVMFIAGFTSRVGFRGSTESLASLSEVFYEPSYGGYYSALASVSSAIPMLIGIILIWCGKKLPLTAFLGGVRD